MKQSPIPDIPLDKKGHVCPPSNAKHPSDRWESFFIYSFICKFTQLRGKVDGFESAMDFEDALLSPEANPIMTQILARFVLNLRPQTRNLSSDVISSTVATVLQEFLKTNERTVFWNEDYKANMDPFHDLKQGFWGAAWDTKLKILRQLVELQLCHSTDIKGSIDRAWGVVHNKHKKGETTPAPPPPSDPNSRENLQLVPIGQDCQRKRYWAVDDSPRVYLSTNPWKITASFQCLSSTRDEYASLVEKLKQNGPSNNKERKTKLEQGHLTLTQTLEDRLPVIDAELARIQRARKRIAQRNLLIAQAEVRETRTRRRTTRPDYAYLNDPEEDDDRDEYKFHEEEDEDFNYDSEDFNHDGPSTRRQLRSEGTRRSTRATRGNSNGQGTLDDWSEWQGGRRSTRLVAHGDTQPEGPPPKRARTTDSTASSADGPAPITPVGSNGLKVKIGGAAALKPTETVVESVAGKKKSKFWVYAVEPVAPSAGGEQDETALPPPSSDYEMSDSVGPSTTGDHHEDVAMDNGERASSTEDGSDDGSSYKKGGLSNASSMDES